MGFQIKMANHYYKVKRQHTATLLAVREFFLDERNTTYGNYERASEESSDGCMGGGKYAQLIFIGDKGIPFSHLEDIKYIEAHKRNIGMEYEIITRSDSVSGWRKQKYGK